MTNQEIAAVFQEIADMLGLKDEDWFKIRAYLKVVQSIEALQEPVANMAAEKKLRQIPGVGDAIETKIEELVATGRLTLHEQLKLEFPDYKGHKVD